MSTSSDRTATSRRTHPHARPTVAAVLVLLAAGLALCLPGTARALGHAGNISANETWLAADNPHVLTATVTILAGVTLTLEPGVQVRLPAGRVLYVYGNLSAVGTALQPITFTRDGTSAWQSLQFASGGSGTLVRCQLDNASYGIYQAGSGIVDLNNCTINHCGYGVYLSSGMLKLGSTTITDCTSYGIYATGIAPVQTDGNVVVDNCGTGFYLTGVSGLNLIIPVTVRNNTTAGLELVNCLNPSVRNLAATGNTGTLGAQHYENCGEVALGPGSIGGAGALANLWGTSLGPGSFLTATSSMPTTGNTYNDIRLGGSTISTRNGTLRKFGSRAYAVDGTYLVPTGTSVTIEAGTTVKLGSGRAITVQGTLLAIGSVGSEIQFVRLGASNWHSIQFTAAGNGTLGRCHLEYAAFGVYQTGTGTVNVTDCSIDHGGYGLYAASGTLSLGSNTISACTSYGLYGNVAPTLADGNNVIDNCSTGVCLTAVNGLVLTPGLTVRNNTSVGLQLLNCLNPILNNLVLTGNTGSLGAQHYENCGEVALGPASTVGGAGSLANLWGVSLGSGSYLTAGSAVPTTGNTNNDIRLGGSAASTRSGTLRKFGSLAYVVDDAYTVGPEKSLTIAPGVTVRLGNSRTITVQGALLAVGAAGAEIVFTRQTAANWNALQFLTPGYGTLEHCRIEYANYGLYCGTSDLVTVRECELSRNVCGVYGASGAAIFYHTRIIDNSDYGLYLSNMTPMFGSDSTQWNDIYGNGSGQAGRDFRNGSRDVTANWIYWGSTRWLLMMAQIWDKHDDASLGEVFFEPYSNSFHNDDLTGVPGDGPVPALPTVFEMKQNQPNPFNPATVIGFALPRAAVVRLAVYDLAGACVATLADGPFAAGRHEVTWRGTDDRGRAQASGTYFYRLESPEGVLTRRMMLVR